MTILSAYISGIGLLGPGLPSWATSSAILTGEQVYEASKTLVPVPELLPAAERRRASDIVKLSLATSLEALTTAEMLSTDLPSVFSFSNGDGLNCHNICECLASEDRAISPTRFHNSVHNAVAGYWSIATKNMATSSVLCAYDGSFGAGLLDAMTQVVVDDTACILMTSDTPYPEPMHSKRPIPDNLGVALVLTPAVTANSVAKISVNVTQEAADTFSDPRLESLRITYPSGRGLPLLQAIAQVQSLVLSQVQSKRVVIDYLEELRLSVEVATC